MLPTNLRHRMADKHEADLAELFGGRKSPGSGSQWHRQMDVRQSRFEVDIAFAFEGKSTLGKSLPISRDLWTKAVEQAGGERPALALRWYTDDRLSKVDIDLVAMRTDDLAELLDELSHLRAQLGAIEGFLENYPDSPDEEGLINQVLNIINELTEESKA